MRDHRVKMHPARSGTGRWPRWKLALVLSPFVWAAVAINLFLLGLIGVYFGLPGLSPGWSLLLAVPLTIPATRATTRWVENLIRQADE